MSHATFALAVVVLMTLGVAIAVALAVLSPDSVPVVPPPRQTTPAHLGDIRNQPTPVNLDEIPEASVRALFDGQGYSFGPDQRLAQIAKKHEGGFGGYYFDETDKSRVYVYMQDVTKTDSAASAFREFYQGQHTVTTITTVEGQYAFDDLVKWLPIASRALDYNDISVSTSAVKEIHNRVEFGLRDWSQLAEAERAIGETIVPAGAVRFVKRNLRLY